MPNEQKEPESYGSERDRVLSQPEWTDHVDVLRPAAGKAPVDDAPRKVTATLAGARREGFFRRRDWE